MTAFYTAEHLGTNPICLLIVTESKSHPRAAAQENI